MVNYQNSKIYKIVSSQTDKVYIGSTTKDRLCQRMIQHRVDYKSYLNNKKNYISSFEIMKYDDTEIILIETFPCESKDKLHARERYWIENIVNCVNKQVPIRTEKEHNEYHQKYYKKKKETINEKFNCLCGGKYTKCHKSRHEKTKQHQEYLTSKNKL
jgi:hypothetical protein